MSQITLHGNTINTVGTLPAVGAKAPQFTLVKTDLSDLSFDSLAGKNIVLNIFPSIDTSVCALSVKRFNKEASSLGETVVLCVSADLPFAHKRFCAAEGIDRVEALSSFRSTFGKDYGVEIADGPVAGVLSRAILIIGKDGNVIYSQQVGEIGDEPDYDSAIKVLKG